MKKYKQYGAIPERFIHPDSFLSRQSPYPDYTIKDPYQRARDYYLKRRSYERGLESLSNDMWIPIDQICKVRGKQRWQVFRNIETGTEQDPTLILAHLARQSIYSTLVRFQFETDLLLLQIDESFPIEAKIKQLDTQAPSSQFWYHLPIPAAAQVKSRIQTLKNHLDVLAADQPNGQSNLRVNLSEDQLDWIDPSKRLKLLVYEEVYIKNFAQVQTLITTYKQTKTDENKDWLRLA
ncbi:hypothetical protein [Spirosoma litoris]